MSKPDIRWQRDTALRHIEKLRSELNGQVVPNSYLAEKAAKYVRTTTGKVLDWMAGKV